MINIDFLLIIKFKKPGLGIIIYFYNQKVKDKILWLLKFFYFIDA